MIEYQNARQNPNLGGGQGEPDDLPPRNTTRWVARRKAQVVTAVETGALSIGEAMERYRLSLEEFQSWQRALDRSGVAGLRIAAAQRLRRENPPRPVLVKH